MPVASDLRHNLGLILEFLLLNALHIFAHNPLWSLPAELLCGRITIHQVLLHFASTNLKIVREYLGREIGA